VKPNLRIGIVGTGFIARGLMMFVDRLGDIDLTSILTRRPPDECSPLFKSERLTQSIDELVEKSELIVECSGDPIHATKVVDCAMQAGLPVVTMDSEFQLTTGSHFVDKGLITEAEGDQPGCLAALRENLLGMGFSPLVYGNIKGFINTNPEPEEMRKWADIQGISLQQVVSFTDGTKIQIEQAFAANAFQSDILCTGLCGCKVDSLEEGARILSDKAHQVGHPISDFIVQPGGFKGVFIVAEHDECQQSSLRYLKQGEGPYYTMLQPFHLCHLEIVKTIRRVAGGGGVLMNNTSAPRFSVGAIAKRDLKIREVIAQGIGGFDVRGVALRITDETDHVPIGLLQGAVLRENVEAGQLVERGVIDLPDSQALSIWETIRDRAL
jgi:predicted homoserine dehydrogenase-like protein